MTDNLQPEIGPDKSLLLVDDDEPFLRRLAKAMEKRGFEVETAGSVAAGRAIATARPPAYAVVDLRLEDGNGLDVVEVLRERRPDSRVVVLTDTGRLPLRLPPSRSGQRTTCQNRQMPPTSPTLFWPMAILFRHHRKTR